MELEKIQQNCKRRAARFTIEYILCAKDMAPISKKDAELALADVLREMVPILKAHNQMLKNGAVFLRSVGMYVRKGKKGPEYCNITVDGLPYAVWDAFNLKTMAAGKDSLLSKVNVALLTDYKGGS